MEVLTEYNWVGRLVTLSGTDITKCGFHLESSTGRIDEAFAQRNSGDRNVGTHMS